MPRQSGDDDWQDGSSYHRRNGKDKPKLLTPWPIRRLLELGGRLRQNSTTATE